MTAQDRLHAGRMAAMQGKYEEALREYVWFHHHALAEQASLAGVRLSYGLSYWAELGEVYPEALRALEAIRDDKTQTLMRGEGDRDLFHDVTAINGYLGSPASTHSLYVALTESMPELARSCTSLALPAIVKAKDYRLARRVGPDPEAAIRREVDWLKRDVARIKSRFTRAPARWASIRIYVQAVQLQLDIVAGNGEQTEAARLRELAVRLIQDPTVRRDARAEFSKPASGPAVHYRRLPRRLRRQNRRSR